jgi:hypothetical protein
MANHRRRNIEPTVVQQQAMYQRVGDIYPCPEQAYERPGILTPTSDLEGRSDPWLTRRSASASC